MSTIIKSSRTATQLGFIERQIKRRINSFHLIYIVQRRSFYTMGVSETRSVSGNETVNRERVYCEILACRLFIDISVPYQWYRSPGITGILGIITDVLRLLII